jgi:hypothetical protein
MQAPSEQLWGTPLGSLRSNLEGLEAASALSPTSPALSLPSSSIVYTPPGQRAPALSGAAMLQLQLAAKCTRKLQLL